VIVGGVELETSEIAGAEPALVFLHEGLGSVALWRDFPARLAEATGRRALIYSRAGHGQSDVPSEDRTPRFMHEEALDVLPAVLREAAIERPVLVGHSDGGSIALIHAAQHPVSALVLLAPHVFVEDITVASIEEARDTFAATDLGARMARYHRDPERTFRLWNDIWLAPEFRDWNIEDVLGHVTAPTLLIQGEHDQYGTLAQIDAIERGLSGAVTRAVLDARHAPHLEAPEETLKAAAEFLR
jgi:pimeloyl-ACP methyl ester carboxylesterase